jgi:uncharacterized protein (DUF1778 family)
MKAKNVTLSLTYPQYLMIEQAAYDAEKTVKQFIKNAALARAQQQKHKDNGKSKGTIRVLE